MFYNFYQLWARDIFLLLLNKSRKFSILEWEQFARGIYSYYI